MRVHILAKELGVTSKAILEKCRAEGLELKNHMATLSAGLEATVREWFSEGVHETVEEKAERVDLKKVRKKTTRKRATKKKAATTGEQEEESEETAEGAVATAVAEAVPAGAEEAVQAAEAATAVVAAPEAGLEAGVEVGAPEGAAAVVEAPAEATVAEAPAGPAAPEAGAAAPEAPSLEPVSVPLVVEEGVAPPEEEAGRLAAEAPPTEPDRAEPEGDVEEEVEPEPIAPAGPQLTAPAPAQLQGPQVIRVEAPEPERRFRPRTGPPRSGPPRTGPPRSGPPRGAGRGGGVMPPMSSERGPVGGAPGAKRGRGKDARGAPGEEARGKSSKHRVHPRRSTESREAEERIREFRDRDLIEREERLKAAGERGGLRRRAAETRGREQQLVRPRESRIEIAEPIILKDLCAAMGIGLSRMFPKLTAMGKMARITDAIDRETARLVAAEFDIELMVREARSLLDELKEQSDSVEREHQGPRPPVVTLLGHVDHGKTSLLDAIRKSRVIDQEAGGITQQIGAYRVREGNVDVTFIDTPGHEAFTSMRSRGATMTDVVVLVVAADDGVMQTTREAIQHARAADVPIVVALNKIDLPGVDVNRTYGQLAEENLAPAEWGGEVDVIKTSAITGEGVSDLLEHLTTLTDLLELRADPTIDATGWVIEAEERKGEGIVATLLVSEGSLEPGDVIVCGPSNGRVRAMRDDHGRKVEVATPCTPVMVSGLDVVPTAGDRFYQVGDLKRAKQIAEEQQDQMRAASLAELSKPQTLEEIFKEREADEVPELNVILRSDTHGKLETLRSELNGLTGEQVRVRIVLDGIGAVTESDVILASTSDAIIIGFWVVAEESARRMGQEMGVDIRMYRVIYEVTDDIRAALEGMLEPERQEEYQGRLEVRQVFNIARLGTVAGCYMADGVVARNHRLRLIRDATVVREDCAVGSLRRVKDDVREVRAGFECGLRIEGFDDVHVGDVIEVYEVVEVARTLT